MKGHKGARRGLLRTSLEEAPHEENQKERRQGPYSCSLQHLLQAPPLSESTPQLEEQGRVSWRDAPFSYELLNARDACYRL